LTEFTVEGIPHEGVNSAWNDVEPLLEKALDRGRSEWTTDDIRFDLMKRDSQLWVGKQNGVICGAGVTQIRQYPRLRVCLFILGGGSQLKFYKWGIHIIEEWARSHQCEEIRIHGRRGWLRFLDWDEAYTVAAKRL
jgi:hypothetical protein